MSFLFLKLIKRSSEYALFYYVQNLLYYQSGPYRPPPTGRWWSPGGRCGPRKQLGSVYDSINAVHETGQKIQKIIGMSITDNTFALFLLLTNFIIFFLLTRVIFNKAIHLTLQIKLHNQQHRRARYSSSVKGFYNRVTQFTLWVHKIMNINQ